MLSNKVERMIADAKSKGMNHITIYELGSSSDYDILKSLGYKVRYNDEPFGCDHFVISWGRVSLLERIFG